MSDFFLFDLDLCLFDGGAAGGAGSGSGAGTATAGAAEGADSGAGETKAEPVKYTRKGKSGEYDSVRFGKQPESNVPAAGGDTTTTTNKPDMENAETQTTSNTLEDRQKAYQELIRGEYKDEYTKDTQRIIDRRFKETKGMEEQLKKQAPIMKMLMGRYGINGDDMEALAKALDQDSSIWEAAAEEAGMTVDQYRQYRQYQQEHEELEEIRRQQANRQQAENQLQQWYSEAEAMAPRYPSFDLATEAQNPDFLRLLQANVPVEHAYRLIHMDELTEAATTQAAQAAEKRVVDNIRAKGQRPTENGTSSQSAFTVKDDVSKLSKKDRAEIARRAERGEVISF